jgi:hypothetical protein
MPDKTMHVAFAEAYAEIDNPKKNATNPAFRSKYANLEEMLNVTRPVLSAEGFSIVQEPVSDGDHIGVHTRLMHKSGDEIDFGSFTVPLAKLDAQGAGSALTYCRRYAISSIFGLAQEDDDGNKAAEKPEPPDELVLLRDASNELKLLSAEAAKVPANKEEYAIQLGRPKTLAEAAKRFVKYTPEQKDAVRKAARGELS